MKPSKKLLKQFTTISESLGWNVSHTYDKNTTYISLQRYSTYGQDFHIELSSPTRELYNLPELVHEYYYNFDVDYETYIWLDNFGHGQNGAPYHIKNVLEDMEECENEIFKLYNELLENWKY